jgi:Kef-type K+ transport system membrane component KefB
VVVTIMLGSAHYESRMSIETAVLHPLYLLGGSMLVGAAMAWVARVIARAIEKDREVHFTLLAGLVIGAVGLSTLLKLPVILALLAFGLFARNDERGYALLNVNLAPVGRLLYIVLFVITGASLTFESLAVAGWAGLAIVAARAAGKMAGVLLVAPLGGLRIPQTLGLGLALLPMSSLSLLLHHDIARLYPGFDAGLSAAFLAAIIVMEVAGPLAVQFGLRLAGETLPEEAESQARPRAA